VYRSGHSCWPRPNHQRMEPIRETAPRGSGSPNWSTACASLFSSFDPMATGRPGSSWSGGLFDESACSIAADDSDRGCPPVNTMPVPTKLTSAQSAASHLSLALQRLRSARLCNAIRFLCKQAPNLTVISVSVGISQVIASIYFTVDGIPGTAPSGG
jgi:hypothetical protein